MPRGFQKGNIPWCRGKHLSEEHKRKISISNIGKRLGKKMSEDAIKKRTESRKGFRHSEESKRKIGEASRGHKVTEETKIKMKKNHNKGGYFLGCHHTAETKKKIGEKHKGKIVLDETRQKISLSHQGNIPWNKGKTGIYSEETLQNWSKKRKGKSSPIKGCHRSEETKRKISKSKKQFYLETGKLPPCVFPKGQVPWNRGLTKETDERVQKISEKLKGRNTWSRGRHLSEETLHKMLKGRWKRPTSYERKIIKLISKYHLPFKYVGDGQVIIGYKNPDFVEINGKKLLIETYGKYWYSEDYEEKRSKFFFTYNFKTLFLNDNDLLSEIWEEICLEKIQTFLEENS